MSKLDYLITKMNIKGIYPGGQFGVEGAEPDLVTNDVYAAMGMGHLSHNAYIFGMAFVNQDPHMVCQAFYAGTVAVAQLAADKKWSVRDTLRRNITILALSELLDIGPYNKPGRVIWHDTERAEFCEVKYKTWLTTWRKTGRYQNIQAMFVGWTNEFGTHIEERC